MPHGLRPETSPAGAAHGRLSVVEVDPFVKPAWVDQLLGTEVVTRELGSDDGLTVTTTEVDGLSHVQVVLPRALEVPSRQFQDRVTGVYAVIREQLERCRTPHPLRFWNYVPGILETVHDGLARYEVFNAGRFAAFSAWYRTASFGSRMIAASGVGHRGADFVVQVLAADRPGRGLENPRQRSAYRYSRRYGPLPPCFARATVVEGPVRRFSDQLVIVAGTASVVGEDSRHEGDLEKQLAETFTNLESLLERARVNGGNGNGNGHGNGHGNGRSRDLLSEFRELRVYVVEDSNREPVIDHLAARFSRLERLEVMPADLCRGDLLVEIEGIVGLD